MIEFKWELKQVVSSISKGLLEKQATFFLRPHDAIWGDRPADFEQLAEEIVASLPDVQMRRQFLSVCLGSYLLNPAKVPKDVLNWIQGRMPVAELLGIDVSLDGLLSWRWDRAAFPVLDEYENGKYDTIYYALVAKTKSGSNPLYPSWASEVMNTDALDAVAIAAELAGKAQPDSRFFFWPFINPRKPTHDRSLGLPVYLSFKSLVKDKPVPMTIATGEVDRQGRLHPVHGVFDKCDKAFEKKYKKFIYPEDGSFLERRREQRPVGVNNLEDSEYQWGILNIELGKMATKSLPADCEHAKIIEKMLINKGALTMPKQKFFINEDELDKLQHQLLEKRIDRSMVVSGCAGSGKTILALWKAKRIQAAGYSYKYIVFTRALHQFMSDGIKAIGLTDDNFMYYEQWKKLGLPSADFIIVDEVQDFTQEEISQFKSSANKAFFFWGDSAQSLYKEKGPKNNRKPTQDIQTIAFEARIMPEPLQENHRLPKKIARFAEFLTDDEDLVVRCEKEGAELPRILHYNTLEEQLDVAMQQIKNRNITDAAILFPTNSMVERGYDYLKSKGQSIERKIDDQMDLNFDSDNPKLMTYHSAKGLQFEAVFLPECVLPEIMGVKPLYVAVTRCYRYLFVMYSSQLSRYFDTVPRNLYSTSLEADKIEL